MVKYEEVKIGDLSRNDIIIALIGPTGAGMSTFINVATGHDSDTVGHGLQPFTTDFRAVRVRHPRTSRSIVFVDTPGFDDMRRSDSEVLKLLSQKSKIKLAGIIYLHRISDNRKMTAGTPFRNLGMFADLCGEDAIRNVILATTMWSRVDEDVGTRRENELKQKYWKTMLDNGSTTIRFLDSFDSTWDIVDTIIDKARAASIRETSDNSNGQPTTNQVNSTKSKVQTRRVAAREITNHDFVVVLFGLSGTGKSSFINLAIGADDVPIGDGLEPCTSEIQSFRCVHPDNDGSIVFVDTPAPSDDMKPDAAMTKWLNMACLRRRSVDGILYMHRISDLRMTESPLAHLKTFETLCGPDFQRKTLLVTTQWDLVDKEKGKRREDELRTKYWRPMMIRGSGMLRFDNTTESAWRAVDLLVTCNKSTAPGEGV